MVRGLYLCAAILTVCGREIGGAPVDDATEIIQSKISQLNVNSLADDGDLGLLGLKLPLSP
jgi:hypothetical protein